MAVIRPFAGIRPCQEKAGKIAALPYDVYNRQEAKKVVEQNPESFLKIDRAETQFEDSVGTYENKVYQRAHDTLWEMVEKGDFVREAKPCYYIYELTMDGRVQTGIAACASIDDYLSGTIKKHENTRAEKEADRICHVDACNAQTGPIFLAYRANAVIRDMVNAKKQETPLYDFVSEDGIRHRVFVIEDEGQIKTIQETFEKIGEIYIADGHHRAASAVKVGLKRRESHPDFTGEEEFNYFLSVLFPDEELMIMDYNRVVKDLNGLSPADFLNKVNDIFEVEKLDSQEKPKEKGQVSMYLDGNWYLLTIKEEDKSNDPVEGLDVSLLQKLLLQPVLGIENPKTDERIDFVGGIRGLGELEKRVSTDCAVAFAMYPTSIGELFGVADAGKLMPPKSTWFEPKLRSGLFIHEI
ncbi:DUF1015 domain-containing protein [Roseburia sp. 1XD42-69]|uniref:DUF1015 domain-containing protein n=1 Tax=Roseburia sp. 1XD42-69 TaxID=2320088 RepID=UPI000EA36C39|nr:DUF1015 family protein [Roseburia sp. 1XD42-69]RKJ62526.1 DUF1015 domain-containing protein [Roseburia sp. 1XD42-69]